MDAARFWRGSESERTYRLKWAAWEWRYNAAGCRCIGFEVRRHGPRRRIVDVGAVGPGNQFYVVEVKSSRADFARDNHTDADVARRIALAETPGYCFRNDDRERLARERERLAAISTKFHDPRFPAAADYYYIMAPTGAASTEMLPPQWGLLDAAPSEVVGGGVILGLERGAAFGVCEASRIGGRRGTPRALQCWLILRRRSAGGRRQNPISADINNTRSFPR